MSSTPFFRKPQAVRPGEQVAVIAPAGPFDRAAFDAGLAALGDRYRIRYDARIFDTHRYLAGDDARRLEELRWALGDPAIKAIFCARGGYGAMRLLPRLAAVSSPSSAGVTSFQNDDSAAAAPVSRALKSLVGFSDITALHSWLLSDGIAAIHGPVLTQLGHQPRSVCERLFALLESSSPAAPLSGTQTWVGGIAEGPLVGGNLAVLSRLLGTPYLPPLEGSVLLLEDVGERPYKLDRMWTHLALAGVFRKVRGIVLGSFTGCEERDATYTSADVLRELATATALPCAAGFPIGHGELNEPVPLGARVRLDADSRRLEFLEPVVAEP